MCIAQDSCRAAVGTCDGKVLVYDMHSGRLDRTFTSHSAEVCGLQVSKHLLIYILKYK